MAHTLTFLPALLKDDPRAVPYDSDDALIYLTPTLGPTATLLAHRLARYVHDEQFEGFGMDDEQLAVSFGLSADYLAKTIARCVMFRVLIPVPLAEHTYRIARGRVLELRWVERMPDYLRITLPYAIS